MHTLSVSDTRAIAVDDADEATRWVHLVDFETKTLEGFSVDGVGSVQSMHFDVARGLLWVISSGSVFAIQCAQREMFEVPPPDDAFYVYSMSGEGSHVYVSGEYSNLWRIALPELEWEPLSTPDAPSADDAEYAAKYPPYYFGFKVGAGHVFCGALARVRDGVVETKRIDGGPQLMTGRVEGAQVSLSADSPGAKVFLGGFDEGFEVLFSDTLAAFHRTALHDGRRYLGVAEYPPSNVHNLYVHDAGENVALETGCEREPQALLALTSTGGALGPSMRRACSGCRGRRGRSLMLKTCVAVSGRRASVASFTEAAAHGFDRAQRERAHDFWQRRAAGLVLRVATTPGFGACLPCAEPWLRSRDGARRVFFRAHRARAHDFAQRLAAGLVLRVATTPGFGACLPCAEPWLRSRDGARRFFPSPSRAGPRLRATTRGWARSPGGVVVHDASVVDDYGLRSVALLR